jgi:hypothetical protein
MRRGEDGEFGPGSAGPSKPTSETGSDSKDKVSKEKWVFQQSSLSSHLLTVFFCRLTREEREEAYNKARQRIFGSVEKTENANQGTYSKRFLCIKR